MSEELPVVLRWPPSPRRRVPSWGLTVWAALLAGASCTPEVPPVEPMDWELLCGEACAGPPVDVDVGAATSCVRYAGGAAICWGIRRGVSDYSDLRGQQGPSLGPTARRPQAVLVGHEMRRDRITGLFEARRDTPGPEAVLDAVDISVSRDNACVVRRDGSLWCWGLNDKAQLGRGQNNFSDSRVPVKPLEPWRSDLGEVYDEIEPEPIVAVEATSWISAILDDGRLVFPLHVMLVSESVRNRPSLSGQYVSCGLTEGRVFCRGDNRRGILGNGTFRPNGGETDEVPLPVDAVQVVIGWAHVCALGIDGGVWCWGDNFRGQLGHLPFGKDVDDNYIRVPTPIRVPGLEDVVQIEASDSQTCAVRADGQLFCWGDDYNGVLGTGSDFGGVGEPLAIPNAGDIVDVDISPQHGCAIRRSGVVVCWGDNGYGQLGPGPSEVHEGSVPYGQLGEVLDLPHHGVWPGE